ncbi:MAG: Fur family transcriptional regulator [Desulfovibrio sp.]
MEKKTEFRLSKQRKVILEELCSVQSHPTADEVYDMVRKRIPKVSLGTVYRNLEFLSSKGLVLKLGAPGAQKRFDGNPKPHAHVRCTICGKVEDLHSLKELPTLDTEHAMGYKILRCELDFEGICPSCLDAGDRPIS